jgi:elongation factor Ts
MAEDAVNIAIEKNAKTADELKALSFDGKITIADKLIEQTGVIGQKIELTKFEVIEAPFVYAYIHPGNKLANIVGFSSATVKADVAKDVAMQVAASASLPAALVRKNLASGCTFRSAPLAE